MLHDLPPVGHCFLALLILVQIHLLKNRLFHQRIDMFCAVFYISLGCSDLHCTDGS